MNVSCCASSRFDAGARKGESRPNKPQTGRGEFPPHSLRDWAPWLRERSEAKSIQSVAGAWEGQDKLREELLAGREE